MNQNVIAPVSQDFGTANVNVGPPAVSLLTVQFSDPTLAPSFVIQFGIEFRLQSSSCASSTSGNLCSVVIYFEPINPGLRTDALIIRDGSGIVIATTLLSGIGSGAQSAVWPGVSVTYAGNGSYDYSGDYGPASLAGLAGPSSVAILGTGDLLIADKDNNVVRRIDHVTGQISPVAGNGSYGYQGDGGPANEAQLASPTAVAVDGAGNIYIADTDNDVIRKVTALTGVITTLAGGGNEPGDDGFGDGGLATDAQLYGPTGVTVDQTGNVYVADTSNDIVRKIDNSTGQIYRIAGGGLDVGTDGLGDGGLAVRASLNSPTGIAIDSSGTIYIADTGNNMVRKVDGTTGQIAVLAGNLQQGYSGDGDLALAASLSIPTSLTLDSAGNIYVADSGNDVIRIIEASSGIITTITSGGDNPANADFQGAPGLWFPRGLAIDSSGTLFVADYGNDLIREIIPGAPLFFSPTIVGESSPTQIVKVFNIGNYPLTIGNIAVSSGFSQQPISSGACLSTEVLASGTECSIALAFIPSATDSGQGTLTLRDNSFNQNSEKVLNLSGPLSTCGFLATPSSVSVGSLGGTGTVHLVGDASCSWQVDAVPNWITITVQTGEGATSFKYVIAANPESSQRFGTVLVGGETINFDQQGVMPPQVIGVTPRSASGSNQKVVIQFTDPRGSEDLGVLNVLINTALDGRNSCYLAFVRAQRILYLVNDSGSGLLPAIHLNASGTVENSQCAIDGSQSYAIEDGDTLTLTLQIVLKQGFSGNKIVYAAARDLNENTPGWQPVGTWISSTNVGTGAIMISSISPSSGSGTFVNLALVVNDAKGADDLGVINVLTNTYLDGRHACYIAFVPESQTLYLVDDSGSALLPGTKIGAPGSIANSQCRIDAGQSSFTTVTNSATLNLAMRFQSSFTGDQIIYLAARDKTESINTGWQPMAAWTVR